MPKKRITMRKLREVFRLKFELKRKHREIATACKISSGTVSDMVKRLDTAGLTWPNELSDHELDAALYSSSLESLVPEQERPIPDWSVIEKELRRPKIHLTLQQLWKEYRDRNPDNHYGYSWFCETYRRWEAKLDPVMRQSHKYGDKCFVDFAGDTLSVIDEETGETRQAQVFVAALGASNYLYCDVCWSQDLPSWLRLHLDMFEYLGGCPAALVPDNLKSGVTSPCYYEPSVNISYEEMAKYHGVAVIPARVRKPKDKAKAENGVLIVEREILALLRDRTLVGLSGAKEAVWALLEVVNNRPFQKLEGSRDQLFREYEFPELRPLPKQPYDAGIWSTAKVHIDYHIEVKKHYYSVPFQHIGQRVDVRLTSTIIEVFLEGERVASHRRGWKRGGCLTKSEHMPDRHRCMADWTPARVCSWADSVGEQTSVLARGIMERRQHPEQGVRAVLGVLSLKKKYGRDRLEAACRRAVELGGYSRRTVLSILEKGIDKAAPDDGEKRHIGHHENVRGPEYYGGEVGCHAAAANNR